ncbi:MAG TPA: F0F1 ATP synthase subunit epsilon [Anaerolineae bacterium]
MPIRCEVVSVERVVYQGDADMVLAPGIEGELGILPHHAPLMTALAPGEVVIRKAAEETHLAVGGGFMEVRPDRVTILADSAEKAEEIDVARAEAARQRAEQLLSQKRPETDLRAAEYALRRSQVRLKVARRRRPGVPSPGEHGNSLGED